MSDAEELARKERRRRLIERLNEKEELAAEIERQRTLNAARRGLSF